MVSNDRNNQLCASFSVFRSLSLSLSLSLRRTSFTTPRRGVVPLWSKPFVFGLDCVSFIPLETTPMDEMTSVAREEDNTTTRDDAARRIRRRGTSGRRFSRPPRVVVGVVSGSLSLVFFCASEKRALSQTLEGRALVAKTKLSSSKREKERGKKRL